MTHAFQQVDVFTSKPFLGNPLAVVFAADDLDDAAMLRFANWTNLSETTFILKPNDPVADYRVRIFTPTGELPFAGHPTLGTCYAWLRAGGKPKAREIKQECAVGIVSIREIDSRLFFAAPPLSKFGPVAPELIDELLPALSLKHEDLRLAYWTDNGPGWISLLLNDAETVSLAKPNFQALKKRKVGLVGAYDNNAISENGPHFELRAFTSFGTEDPVTGSLNAGVAQWLIGAGIAPPRYIASQGTALGREGRVHVESIDGNIWVGGDVICCIEGRLDALGH